VPKTLAFEAPSIAHGDRIRSILRVGSFVELGFFVERKGMD